MRPATGRVAAVAATAAVVLLMDTTPAVAGLYSTTVWVAVSLKVRMNHDSAPLVSIVAVAIAFATLTALELVLGIDNIIFISILVDKLPKERREFARRIGLFMAMFIEVIQSSKNTFWVYMAAMAMFGMTLPMTQLATGTAAAP